LNKYKCRARKLPVAPLLTSRGCPYNCIFCNKSIFGHTFRARSPENILKEIDYLINDFGIKQLDILDDNFTLNIDRAEKFLDMFIEKDYDLLINCQNGVRADRVTRKLIHKMKLAGVFKVGVGIESGNQKVLKKIKKQLNLERVKQVFRWFREVNIITYGFFMLGFPWDTPKTMQETIDFAKESNPDIANFMITIPFPGTELYDYVMNNGKFIQKVEEGIFSGFYGNCVFFETNTTKKEDVLKYFKKSYKEFYIRPKKLLELLITPKSTDEFEWIIDASLVILKSILNKN
jgi:radical SAM superfamily enzyme YgiQ (UPF0313 family)